VALVAICVVAGAWFYHRRLGKAVALAPLAALAAGGACVAIMKSIINRPRPALPLHLVPETDASFPSGHATDSAAVFVTIALLVAIFVVRRPLARAVSVSAGLVATGVIGLSRLELGVHWPTDVVAGWALGLCAALVVTATVWVLGAAEPTTTGGPRLVDDGGAANDRARSGRDPGDGGAVRAA
jgi:undecaprenyl-diphosphatase